MKDCTAREEAQFPTTKVATNTDGKQRFQLLKTWINIILSNDIIETNK
jgi:hypothetical protein